MKIIPALPMVWSRFTSPDSVFVQYEESFVSSSFYTEKNCKLAEYSTQEFSQYLDKITSFLKEISSPCETCKVQSGSPEIKIQNGNMVVVHFKAGKQGLIIHAGNLSMQLEDLFELVENFCKRKILDRKCVSVEDSATRIVMDSYSETQVVRYQFSPNSNTRDMLVRLRIGKVKGNKFFEHGTNDHIVFDVETDKKTCSSHETFADQVLHFLWYNDAFCVNPEEKYELECIKVRHLHFKDGKVVAKGLGYCQVKSLGSNKIFCSESRIIYALDKHVWVLVLNKADTYTLEKDKKMNLYLQGHQYYAVFSQQTKQKTKLFPCERNKVPTRDILRSVVAIASLSGTYCSKKDNSRQVFSNNKDWKFEWKNELKKLFYDGREIPISSPNSTKPLEILGLTECNKKN